MWPKIVVSKVATQCTNLKFTSTTCITSETENNRKSIMSKETSVYEYRIYVFVQFTVKLKKIQKFLAVCSISGNAIA